MSLRIDRKTNLIIDSNVPDLLKFELNEDKIYDRLSYPVDDLMAPIISLLNQKGYTTNYCCSGHFTNGNYKVNVDTPLEEGIDIDTDTMTLRFESIIDTNNTKLYAKDKQKYSLDTVPYLTFNYRVNNLIWKEEKPFKGTVWEEVIRELNHYPGLTELFFGEKVKREEINSSKLYGFGIYMNIKKFNKKYNKYSDDYFKIYGCLFKESKKLYDIIKDKLKDYESIQ